MTGIAKLIGLTPTPSLPGARSEAPGTAPGISEQPTAPSGPAPAAAANAPKPKIAADGMQLNGASGPARALEGARSLLDRQLAELCLDLEAVEQEQRHAAAGQQAMEALKVQELRHEVDMTRQSIQLISAAKRFTTIAGNDPAQLAEVASLAGALAQAGPAEQASASMALVLACTKLAGTPATPKLDDLRTQIAARQDALTGDIDAALQALDNNSDPQNALGLEARLRLLEADRRRSTAVQAKLFSTQAVIMEDGLPSTPEKRQAYGRILTDARQAVTVPPANAPEAFTKLDLALEKLKDVASTPAFDQARLAIARAQGTDVDALIRGTQAGTNITGIQRHLGLLHQALELAAPLQSDPTLANTAASLLNGIATDGRNAPRYLRELQLLQEARPSR